MQFGASGFGSVGLGSLLQENGAAVDPTSVQPILTEWNGIDARAYVSVDSLRITDTLGQPVTCRFIMKRPPSVPAVGDRIRIFYFSQLIFSGTIDHTDKSSEDLSTFVYDVDCVDWSQTLVRRKIRRNFTNMTVQAVLDSLLDNELAGELLTIGTIESSATIPLVDSKNGKALDIARDMANATGQTFYVDFDQSLQMRSTTVPVAPLDFSEANVLVAGTRGRGDRETYRNVQTVIVTGTPAASEDALVTTQQRRNEDQIAQRAAIEGGTGIYEEIEEVTHPTSNDGAQIALLGISYARLLLATAGTPRESITCTVRGYGFRAGQVAIVTLPTFGVSGSYVIQSVSLQELAGQFLFHEIELTISRSQQRAYESWLRVVRTGKVTVQVPASITSNLQTFNTPGFDSFIVPAGVTVLELTCYGASSGGSGGSQETNMNPFTEKCTSGSFYSSGQNDGVNGAIGGNSGKSITVLNVTPGDTVTIFVGSAGLGGSSATAAFPTGMGIGTVTNAASGDGTDGTASAATYKGLVVCQGDGGKHGVHAHMVASRSDAFAYRLCKFIGTAGTPGSGVGDAVSVGGGFVGGAKGIGNASTVTAGAPGSDGRVEVRW